MFTGTSAGVAAMFGVGLLPDQLFNLAKKIYKHRARCQGIGAAKVSVGTSQVGIKGEEVQTKVLTRGFNKDDG